MKIDERSSLKSAVQDFIEGSASTVSGNLAQYLGPIYESKKELGYVKQIVW
ncbi:hypothetical protein [Desulfosporosinus hippei]|uniref:hypothetical protein n=1 Tax=Desulfosporosinus hippei TaxID=569859 RepID=UPI001A9A403B|nr:hypothetical protein [Desulfosporosinus hippei]